MSWNIEGKQVLLTGASRGIGRATALALAKQNANLTLLVRNRELGEKVVEELRAVGGKGRVDLDRRRSLVDERRRTRGRRIHRQT